MSNKSKQIRGGLTGVSRPYRLARGTWVANLDTIRVPAMWSTKWCGMERTKAPACITTPPEMWKRLGNAEVSLMELARGLSI